MQDAAGTRPAASSFRFNRTTVETKTVQAGPQSLKEIPPAPEGSIISKMLLKTKAGSVTHFSFAEGEYLDEHVTPFEALLVVLNGSATIGIESDRYELNANDFIRLPANVPHSVRPLEDMQMLLVMLRTEIKAAVA